MDRGCWLLESAAYIVAFHKVIFRSIFLAVGPVVRQIVVVSVRLRYVLMSSSLLAGLPCIPSSLSAWLISLQYSWRKALSNVLGVSGHNSCLCPEIPPLSDGPRLIPFEANCCMRCSHCEVDPCFQFFFWLDVWHFVVAVCIVDAFFVLSQNLAVWFVKSLVSPSSVSPAVGHSLVFLSVLSSSSWVGVSSSTLQSSSASPNRRREIVSPWRRRA